MPFEVDTESPVVSIVAPPTPSKNTEPSFSGKASEATMVEVHVFEGASQVATATTVASGGEWSTSGLSTALPKGKHTFTAYATEKSKLGNPDGQSGTVPFEVDTESPVVSIVAPPTPSKNTEPSFSGEASEATMVEVHVFEGASQVATATTVASGGAWSTSGLSTALPKGKHTFTAYATEKSKLGNPDGQSGTVPFEVDTESPVVSIVAPPTPSKNTEPSFSGKASEATMVEVHVFEGASQVATATTVASGGEWSTSGLSTALPKGKHTFTAYATEKSKLGNPDGQSGTVPFEVDTEPPEVSIGQPVPLDSATPTFSGTASEETEVEVRVFEGPTEVATATTTASGGHWSTNALSKPLPAGRHAYTAYAKEKSGLGNSEGQSGTVSFEIDTEPPVVSIVAPPSPSKDTNPPFSGEASEATKVEVHVFEGSTEVASASTTAAGGHWSTSGLSKELPKGKHTFTAYATEKSGFGDPDGKSGTVSFEVNTNPPEVSIVAPPSPSNDTEPSFSGEASEATKVEVHVFEGSTEVASASTTASGGHWSTSTLSKELPKGKHTFTAYAKEKSGLGNAEGQSKTVPFEVNTEPPEVSIVAPPSPSNKTEPPFSGEASEATKVEVHVFEGSTEVASASTTASGGHWSTSGLSKALPTGKHTFTAYAKEQSGLGNAEGQSKTVPFEVNTNPPEVTIVGPSSLSNVLNPSFSGEASEATKVEVHVFEGAVEVGSQSTTAAGGKWSLSLSKGLPPGKHTFTAYAKEKSGLGNAEGQSGTVTFEVNTNPPEVSIVAPSSPSNVTNPPFSGEASEATKVEVHVFVGETEVGSGTTTASGGKWSLAGLTKALPSGKHTFTAYAKEKSGLGNAEGQSGTVSFEVNTEPPEVSIVAPSPSLSNNTEPSFGGAASEATKVEVHVLEGTSEVASASTTAAGGKWSTTGLSKALPKGKRTFTAYATEKSGLGNADGKSKSVSFEVNTEPPVVSIVAPTSPSNNLKPSFSGEASEATAVEVRVHTAEGEITGSTTASGGKWSLSSLSKELPKGKHTFTAYAKEKSGLGNPEGESKPVTFEVNTEPPVVVVQPPAELSNETTPAFSGTASETKPVTVEVFDGERAEGEPIVTVVAGVAAGAWQTAHLTSALPNATYTVRAREESSLGNPEGFAVPRTFTINTEAPDVELKSPPSPSNKTEPAFSGTVKGPAGATVTVYVHAGTSAQGPIVAEATGTISHGTWGPIQASPALKSGQHTYTAVAAVPSSIGNKAGLSNPVTFFVNTEAANGGALAVHVALQ